MQAFLTAVNKLMYFEVGGWWDVNVVGAQDGTNHHACGYSVDPLDPGGETKYGISKNENPSIDVANLNWDDAQAIYYKRYWLAGHCDQLPGCVGALHFDGCVNNGVGEASKFLQRAVGVSADGVIGPQTIATVNNGDPISICNSICDQRENFYRDLVANRPADSKYLNGWLYRVQVMRQFTTDPNGNF
jgi:lysozyme family protein